MHAPEPVNSAEHEFSISIQFRKKLACTHFHFPQFLLDFAYITKLYITRILVLVCRYQYRKKENDSNDLPFLSYSTLGSPISSFYRAHLLQVAYASATIITYRVASSGNQTCSSRILVEFPKSREETFFPNIFSFFLLLGT